MNLEASTAGKNREKSAVDFLFGFDVPDEVLCNIPLPKPQVQQAEKTGSCVLSGCVFNNCTVNFGSLSSSCLYYLSIIWL